jgi:hypothetical protein
MQSSVSTSLAAAAAAAAVAAAAAAAAADVVVVGALLLRYCCCCLQAQAGSVRANCELQLVVAALTCGGLQAVQQLQQSSASLCWWFALLAVGIY